MKKESCVIIIPIYREKLVGSEEKSLMNIVKIFKNRKICLIVPELLNTEYYTSLGINNLEIICFDPGYFTDAIMYSELLLKSFFYKTFQQFTYMLICHVDAWIFEDQLDYWMEQGYDYIGAPLVSISRNPLIKSEKIIYPYGGNGGLSLRKIDKMISFLDNDKHKINWESVKRFNIWLIRNFKVKMLALFWTTLLKLRFKPEDFFETPSALEDYVLSVIGGAMFNEIKAAKPEHAMLFSFEYYPEVLFELTNHVLPFGCHAFTRIEFWNKYIQS